MSLSLLLISYQEADKVSYSIISVWFTISVINDNNIVCNFNIDNNSIYNYGNKWYNDRKKRKHWAVKIWKVEYEVRDEADRKEFAISSGTF